MQTGACLAQRNQVWRQEVPPLNPNEEGIALAKMGVVGGRGKETREGGVRRETDERTDGGTEGSGDRTTGQQGVKVKSMVGITPL